MTKINNTTVKKLYSEYNSVAAIAHHMGVSVKEARTLLSKYNIPVTLGKARQYDFSKTQLTKLYVRERKTIRQIATEFSCDKETVRRNMIRHNIERR